MANAASLTRVVPSINKGNDYLPGTGPNGLFPGSEVPSSPSPTPAINSGKKISL